MPKAQRLEPNAFDGDAVIPSTRFTPANLKAEEEMLRRRSPALSLLPTELLAKRRRELNDSVDSLVKEDRGPWDSEHRRQHDALARKKKEQLTTAAGIIAVAVLILINAELAARCFDPCPVEASSMGKPYTTLHNQPAVATAMADKQLTQMENRTCR